jgi:hypothetical protein
MIMSTLAQSWGTIKRPWQWAVAGAVVLLIWGVVALPRYNSRMDALSTEPVARPVANGSSTAMQYRRAVSQTALSAKIAEPSPPAAAGDAIAGRKMIRTASLNLVVQHPADVVDKITKVAENLGGYLEAAENGGDNATAGTLTIRVPAARFDQARAEIRKLGLRVESDSVAAQDVTRQYVDEDANLRNLRAEEAQYLAIMKQAGTVKEMLAVTEQLSNVRGQIEQQQAEFNALSHQIETVSIAVSLRTEAEAQVLGLNWRPGYQLKLAMRDGVEGIANFATVMIGILFYLPVILLWAGTILLVLVIAFKAFRWLVGRSGWKRTDAVAAASKS